ncbi:MAG TPA: prepilin peptidase [Thermoanaerobaculia bacterium]|nr:prepilin peptidase [Thermoanaerobaculia bacterium]
MEPVLAFFALALGLIIGSFLNVVIHRYPREESIVFPPSRCPSCGTAIRPYDNIPVLSYLWLRGRCRSCREPISMRYPLVELANGLFYMAIMLRTGLSPAFIPAAALVSMFLVLIYIDADIQMLPDVITYPGIAIGLAAGALGFGALEPELMLAADWIDAVLGAILGASIITTIILVYWLIRRIEGMGWGDVKMMAMIGATLGFDGVLPVLLIASVTGAMIGVPMALKHEKGMQVALPFGIFLGIAALVLLFFGPALWSWYLALLVT